MLVVATLALAVTALTSQAALCHRAEVSAVNAIAGNWSPPCGGCIGGKWLLFYHAQTVTLKSSGGGYYQRWNEIKAYGPTQQPTTHTVGTNIHVADWFGQYPCGACTGCGDWIWQRMAYWLNGTIQWTNNENGGGSCDLNFGFQNCSWQDIVNGYNSSQGHIIRDNC